MILGIHHFCRWEYSISWFACKNHQNHIVSLMFCLSWIFYLLDLLIAFWTILSVVQCFLNILSVGSCIYIYRFSASSMDYWLLYPTKNDFLTFQLVNLGDLVELHILSLKPHKNCFIKKWISLVSLVCWNILSGGWEMLKVWFWKNSKI